MSAYPAIADYALLGDCHSSALASRDGSIDWCCLPRFDAPPVFGRVLDWERGGCFRIAPAGPYRVERRYLPETNVLETRFETPGGVLVLIDCIPVHLREAHERGQIDPYNQILRLARCEAGEVEVVFDFRPRFDYGLTVPRLEVKGEGIALAYGGSDALLLQTDFPVHQDEVGGCESRTLLRAGDERLSAVTHMRPHRIVVERLDRDALRARIDETIAFWRWWVGKARYEGPYREQVVRSALVLKALTSAPTGAIVAAPTTSLPEDIGGVRNWDYRYTWVRDAALSLHVLFRLGYVDEAHSFMRWLRRSTAGRGEDLRVMYGIGGERFIPEFDVPQLEGYRGSRPVRVGNFASQQTQLDIYGELLDTAWLYHRHGGYLHPVFWDLLRAAVDLVCRTWEEPDHGIWEVRSDPRQFVSSKLMAWVALDRGIRLARERGLEADLERWTATRRTIRRRVESDGVDAHTGAFVQELGSDALDASTLLAPLVGFVRGDDPRAVTTVERIEKELSEDGLVYRYRGTDDGLPGGEGTFVICSFWLVSAIALAGDAPRARELFEALCARSNDVGLLSEQIDPRTGDLLGNFPQAFSHVGLIGAAWNIQRAEERTR